MCTYMHTHSFPPPHTHAEMSAPALIEENTLSAVAATLKGMIERREEADTVEEWLESIDPTLFIAELSFYSSEVRER